MKLYVLYESFQQLVHKTNGHLKASLLEPLQLFANQIDMYIIKVWIFI